MQLSDSSDIVQFNIICRPLVLFVHIQFLPILFSACIIARRTTTILNSPIRLHLYSSLFYTVVPIFAPFWSSRRSSVYIPNSVTN